MLSPIAIINGFMDELRCRARYDIRGEKPLAVVAALEYCAKTGIIGEHLLRLLPPHAHVLRPYFLGLAERYSDIKSPSSSWSVITGKNRELQDAVRKRPRVNEAFSKLSMQEMQALCHRYAAELERGRQNISRTKNRNVHRLSSVVKTYEVKFEQDIERAATIARTLYEQFRDRTGFFKGYEMPEYIPPSGLERSSRGVRSLPDVRDRHRLPNRRSQTLGQS